MRSNFVKMEFENRAQRPSILNFGADVARFQRFSVNKLVTVSHEFESQHSEKIVSYKKRKRKNA